MKYAKNYRSHGEKIQNIIRHWHDKWSKTFVVDKEELKELKRLLEEQKQMQSIGV